MVKSEICAMNLLQKGRISADKKGRIWRHWDGRNNVKRWLKIPREIKPRSRKGGNYLFVHLFCPELGRQLSIRIHRLVWMAFCGEIPDALEINHKDGNKQNNKLDNLELVTTQENAVHAHRIGLINSARGEQVNTTKLTAKQVMEIRHLYANGNLSTRQIAPKFNVSYHQVWMIVSRKSWKHIE